MKIVLLFFCAIFIILITIIAIIIFSSIKLNIEKCYISNIRNGIKKKEIDKKFIIYMEFYLFGIIKIAKIKITKKLLERFKIKPDIKELEENAKKIKYIHPIEIIKKVKIKLEHFDLKLLIGTESIMFTVYAIRYTFFNYSE